VDALIHLKALGVAHRDVKLENVIITNKAIKLADFGVSAILGNGQRELVYGKAGTATYMAPEIIRTHSGYNPFKSDIYSLGVLIENLLKNDQPLDDNNTTNDIHSVEELSINQKPALLHSSKSVGNVDSTSAFLTSIIDRMKCDSPEHRISFQEIQHLIGEFVGDLPIISAFYSVLADSVQSRLNKFLIRAMTKQDPFAQFYLGLMYYKGLGIPKDIHQALSWFEKSGSQGNFVAQSYVGGIYMNGSLGIDVNYKLALKWFHQFVDYENSTMHPFTAVSYSYLGMIHEKLGDFAKAIQYDLKAIEIRKANLGETHTETARLYNNLGLAYRHVGNFDEAIHSYNKVLEIFRATIGENNAEVAVAYSDLGATYRKLKCNEKAIEFHKKALKIRLQIYGEAHPDTALSYTKLASAYIDSGKLKETCFSAVLENPDFSSRDWSKADVLTCLQKALEIYKTSLGENHPETARTYGCLGCFYQKIEHQYDLAIKYHSKSFEMRNTILGEEHLDTATVCDDLGTDYYLNGNREKAIPFHSKALEIRQKLLGSQHPDTTTTIHNLNRDYGSKEKECSKLMVPH
jgi:tetratricopeptide (TPR) repeat protein